jgi:arylsulfatase A-like enzyme
MKEMKQPNILIFMTDHQRADTVLPDHESITPHVDKLAEEGIRFTNVFCPSPHCCPSRATFHSGLYPSRHGVWNNVCNRQALSRGLKEGVRLWSEDLSDAGYRLHFIGKWHVSIEERPQDRGWIEEFVSSTEPQEHDVTWQYYSDLNDDRTDKSRGRGEIQRPGYGDYQLFGRKVLVDSDHDEFVVKKALELIPSLKENKVPWVMFVGVNGPHDPYLVPQKFMDKYKDVDIPPPPNYADSLKDKPRIYKRMRNQIFGQLSITEVQEGIRHYWAYCTYLDDLFGRILFELEQTGQKDHTLVLYCSDHGDYCGEHGLFCKGIPCFQGAYRVPAVVRYPAMINKCGREVDEFVSLADFCPTFLDVAGLKQTRYFTGRSLLPFFEDKVPEYWRDDIHTQCNGVELYYTQRSVMTKDYKYVFNGFDEDELYDLGKDPYELVNLASDPSKRDIIREMCTRMWDFAKQEEDTITNKYITVALAPFGPGIATN